MGQGPQTDPTLPIQVDKSTTDDAHTDSATSARACKSLRGIAALRLFTLCFAASTIRRKLSRLPIIAHLPEPSPTFTTLQKTK